MKNLSLKKFIITPIALSVLAGTAMAQDVEQGWYVEGNVGQAKGYETQTQLQNATAGNVGTVSPNSQKRRAWKFGGGYRFDNNFSAALTYTDLGNVELGTSTGDSSIRSVEGLSGKAVSLTGAYNQPINDWINAHIKAGFSALNARKNTTTVGAGVNDGDDEDFVWGVGMSFDIAENTSLMLDWERYEFEHKVDLLTAGLRYTFGEVETKEAKPAPIVVAPVVAPVVEPAPVVAPTPVIEVKPLQVTVYFDNNSSALTSETKSILDNAGSQLADGNVEAVSVAGFASALGNADYNQKLSDRRSVAVQEYISANWTLNTDKISLSANGEEEASSIENNGKDRKVTVYVTFEK